MQQTLRKERNSVPSINANLEKFDRGVAVRVFGLQF